jgi:hypothetical protein
VGARLWAPRQPAGVLGHTRLEGCITSATKNDPRRGIDGLALTMGFKSWQRSGPSCGSWIRLTVSRWWRSRLLRLAGGTDHRPKDRSTAVLAGPRSFATAPNPVSYASRLPAVAPDQRPTRRILRAQSSRLGALS